LKVCKKCGINKKNEEFREHHRTCRKCNVAKEELALKLKKDKDPEFKKRWGKRRVKMAKKYKQTEAGAVTTKKYETSIGRKTVNRERQLQQNYNITIADYDKMFSLQNGKCLICERASNKRLVVDHNHSTDEVRGLLCNNCNMGIGLLNDNPITLAKAVDYLTKRGYYGEH